MTDAVHCWLPPTTPQSHLFIPTARIENLNPCFGIQNCNLETTMLSWSSVSALTERLIHSERLLVVCECVASSFRFHIGWSCHRRKECRPIHYEPVYKVFDDDGSSQCRDRAWLHRISRLTATASQPSSPRRRFVLGFQANESRNTISLQGLPLPSFDIDRGFGIVVGPKDYPYKTEFARSTAVLAPTCTW